VLLWMLDKSVKGIISLTTNVFFQRLGVCANIAAVGGACCRPIFSVCYGSVLSSVIYIIDK
jgi:hypothetical protein